MRKVRIALLHVAPIACEVDHNRRLIESALDLAAEQGADWVVTPELCIPGYLFQEKIGTDWILPQPDDWMRGFCRRVRDHEVTVFLSHPERDADTDQLYNTVFVINPRSESVFKIFSLLSLAVFVAVGSYYLWKLGFWKNGNILWTLISIWGLTNAWFYQKKYVH
ncbi:MAG: carbon-nitrogen hydrolase family protein [Deltaproteobacteria bacterium]|nr:carbon-nitrogen hydrolase family protein [Deltaproteobacteria bacterium]